MAERPFLRGDREDPGSLADLARRVSNRSAEHLGAGDHPVTLVAAVRAPWIGEIVVQSGLCGEGDHLGLGRCIRVVGPEPGLHSTAMVGEQREDGVLVRGQFVGQAGSGP